MSGKKKASSSAKRKKASSKSKTDYERVFTDTEGLFATGVDANAIKNTEQKLGVKLPTSLTKLLQWRDGGLFAGKRFLIYSVGDGLHPEETISAANADLPDDYPLLNIGRDASHDFGFREEDLKLPDPPVYAYLHEWGDVEEVAKNLAGWVVWAEKQAKA